MTRVTLATLLLMMCRAPHAPAMQLDVPWGYRRVAAEYAIPPRLFYAIALAESGRAMAGYRHPRPWPWTLNIRGEGRYFAGRRAAEQALHRALVGGEDLIDVGLMQVNWRFHRDRLRNPGSALDPYLNLRIAARILVHCHRTSDGWWAAVGCYHAPADAARAARYRDRVRHHWRLIGLAG